jgi:hypothetical protein
LIINITVASRRAILEGTPSIVCGNRGYFVTFVFDDEWGKDTGKIARFVWAAGGKRKKKDIPFNGDTVEIPKLIGTSEVRVGVFEGDLRTTTSARIYCEQSVLCYDGEPAGEDP